MSATSNASPFVTGFSSQCFPVRSLTNYKRVDEGGAWLVAYRAEQRRRFKAVLCNEPVSPTVPSEKRQEKKPSSPDLTTEETKPKKLDGFYLMKKFYLEDPSDLCSIKVSGEELKEAAGDDFLLFDNVVHVDVGDNNLPFDAFKNFISLRELEMPLNNISGNIHLETYDFGHLEKLDLSYNRLTGADILALGLMENLRTLHLTGNEIRRLPIEMARTYRTITGITASGTVESQDRKVRFSRLENLYLDHNELTDTSTFASLAGLKRLKYLNLEHNEITSIPHLRLLGARLRQSEDLGSKGDPTEPTESSPQQEHPDDVQGVKEGADEEKEASDKEFEMLDEVDEILSRTMPGNEKEEEVEKIGLRPHSSSLTEDASLLGDKYHPPLPFPSLLHLNLANNMIFEEEGLLATMGWPLLRELIIWGNPLTTAFKGDPPVLSMQLARMKGVRIFRQKPPAKRPRPPVNLMANATYRKVHEALPAVPRKRNLLMLEGPPKPDAIAYVGPHPRPLPPISAPAGLGRDSEPATPRNLSTAPAKSSNTPWRVPSRSHSVTPKSQYNEDVREDVRSSGEPTQLPGVGEDDSRQHRQAQAARQTQMDEGFFMTQVDEQEGTHQTEQPKEHRKRKSRRAKHEHPNRPFSVEAKYKGFEDLLDVDETDREVIIPKDIQGSIRSLHFALAHPLIFTDSQGNYKETDSKTTKVSEVLPKPSKQNKVAQLGEILDKMRVQSKTVESNLEKVLSNYSKDPILRQQFPKAKTLLGEVQKKYNEVRVASLRSNATARDLVKVENNDPPRVDSEDLDALPPDFLEEEKEVLQELRKFKKKLDTRI
ncbi:X-ray radiation resistance-associated protein 1 [Nematostella vectensis]|uniref:X-ray radiation resistance-associated protein 1 n=1 Tax=Nematostella vectensis TaxID=45351 RepID=UPI0020773C9C|nr:X-ray radiation resistance-associated protein 1 [Nematostella vectensis]